MSALAQSGGFDEEQLSAEELDSSYSPLRELVTESLHQQEAVLERVEVSKSLLVIISFVGVLVCEDVGLIFIIFCTLYTPCGEGTVVSKSGLPIFIAKKECKAYASIMIDV